MYPNVITIQPELSSISIRTVFIHQYIDMYLLEYKLLDFYIIDVINNYYVWCREYFFRTIFTFIKQPVKLLDSKLLELYLIFKCHFPAVRVKLTFFFVE